MDISNAEAAKLLDYIRNYILRDTQLPKQTQGLWVDVIDHLTQQLKREDNDAETPKQTLRDATPGSRRMDGQRRTRPGPDR